MLLQAYEARRGKVVQVRNGHWKDEFAGCVAPYRSAGAIQNMLLSKFC